MGLRTPGRNQFTDVLLDQGDITQEQLRECIELKGRGSNKKVTELLMEKGYLPEDSYVMAMSNWAGIPHIRVGNYTVSKEVLALVSETLAERHQILPVSITGNTLTIAMADPLDVVALDTLGHLIDYEIQKMVAMPSELKEAIRKYYGSSTVDLPDMAIPEDKAGNIEEVKVSDDQDLRINQDDVEAEPVKNLVKIILNIGLDRGASDIHIEPFERFVRIRYRVDGTLEESDRPIPKNYQQNITARLKILANCRIDEHRLPQDGRCRMRYNGREIDFRVAFLPCKHGEKVVLRVLDKGNLSLDLDKMGFEPQPMAAFREALKLPHGMILMTGPTGSGKTTTLYSALHKLNDVETNVVTVEDPVEYEIFGINQVQVQSVIGFTFAEALRQILRQDPDVVMVGEIRDGETADVAVKAALTGHLVLSTLHTNDAAGVFPRLTDMGIEPFLVQSSVALAAAQRLLKRVCGECKENIHVPNEVLERIQYRPFDYIDNPQFVRGRGCSKCKETGYRGRAGCIEALLNWPELQPLVLQRATGYQIKEQAIACGMKTLRQNSLALAAKGITSIEQVLEHTISD